MGFLDGFNTMMGKKWFVMIMWQVCSIANCSGATLVTYISTLNGYSLPFLQLALTYISLLVLHYRFAPKTAMPWLRYIFVSIMNFGGDVTAIYAYTMTSLASAMMLVTTVIFWVAPISYFYLKRSMSWQQVLSIFIGVAGIVVVFIADGTEGSKWQGNVLALSSAFCYAIANILQEVLVYENSVSTYIFRFTLCTAPVAAICSGAVEWKSIYEFDWSWRVIICLIAYVILLAFYYSFVPVVLQHSNATEMNISFLSVNFFSLGLSILLFGQKASWLYLIGFLFIPVAIVIYCLWGPEKKYENAGPQGLETERKHGDYIDRNPNSEETNSIVDA